MDDRRKSLAASAKLVSGMASPVATTSETTKKHLKPSAHQVHQLKENQQQESNLSQQQQSLPSTTTVSKRKSSKTATAATTTTSTATATTITTATLLCRPMEFQDSPANHIKKSRKSLKEVDLDSAVVDQLVSESANMARMSIAADRQQRRRSSFSLRGKRRSSYGELQALIHGDIAPDAFHRHISVELPDPVRLRQLLVYSFQREREATQKKQEPMDEVDLAAHSVMQDALQGLIMKKTNTSWYHRERENVPLVTQPNPINVRNKQLLEAYEATIQRYQKESTEWDRLLNEYESMAETMLTENVNHHDLEALKTSNTCMDPRVQKCLAVELGGNASLVKKEEEKLRTDVQTLAVDARLVASTLHQLESYVKQKSVHVEKKFTQLIDACWPTEAEEQLDDETLEATKQRLAATRKAFHEDWRQDKTLDLLRVLATAIQDSKGTSSVVEEAAIVPTPVDTTMPESNVDDNDNQDVAPMELE